jgi:hypothetical protein
MPPYKKGALTLQGIFSDVPKNDDTITSTDQEKGGHDLKTDASNLVPAFSPLQDIMHKRRRYTSRSSTPAARRHETSLAKWYELDPIDLGVHG